MKSIDGSDSAGNLDSTSPRPKPKLHSRFVRRQNLSRAGAKKLRADALDANPELTALYSDPKAVALMLRRLGYQDEQVAEALSGHPVGCHLPNREGCRAIIKFGRNGQIAYGAFKAKSRTRKPVWLTLQEVFAAREHGMDWPDARLRKCPAVLGHYRALFAIASGAYKDFGLDTLPLPLLPETVRLERREEREYVVGLLFALAVRLFTADKFAHRGFVKAGEKVMFARVFRDHIVLKVLRDPVPPERREEIWGIIKSTVTESERYGLYLVYGFTDAAQPGNFAALDHWVRTGQLPRPIRTAKKAEEGVRIDAED